MANFFSDIWSALSSFFVSIAHVFQLQDLVDIAIVAFIIYSLIKLVRETRAEQLVKGIAVLLIAYGLAQLLHLNMLIAIMESVSTVGLYALIVVFQPELRRALEQMGRTKIGKFNILGISTSGNEESNQLNAESINAVCESATILQRQRMGALIVFERETKLGEITKTGTRIDAYPTAELLCNIFFNKAPLHDGAVVIRAGKIHSAACILPLSQNHQIARELGTRHRAALGMSENYDAIVVIVSEETGGISLAQNGMLRRNLSVETLRTLLEAGLIKDNGTDGTSGKTPFWKVKSK